MPSRVATNDADASLGDRSNLRKLIRLLLSVVVNDAENGLAITVV